MQNFREEEKFLKVIKHRQPIGMTDYSGVRGFSGDSMAKYLPINAEDTRDVGSISDSGRSPGKENGNSLQYSSSFFFSLQYSCLKNPMERGAWQATVYGVKKRRA